MFNTKMIIFAAAVSLAVTFNTGCAGVNSATPKKEIALQMYSLREDIKKDYPSTVKAMGEMGFTMTEAASYDGKGNFYGKTPSDFKKSIEDAGMQTLSSHTMHRLSKDELANHDFVEAMKWWDVAIAAHKEAGMKYIVMPSMPKVKTLKELKTYCDYYNEIGKRCAASGIAFGYHNHSFEFDKVEGKVMYEYMLQNTDPNYVFFEMDVYWAVRGQNSPVELFQKFPKRFRLLHIKDHKELGQSGMVGFDAIFNNLETAGTEYVVVEVERYNFTPKESVKKSIDYLQKSDFVKSACPFSATAKK